MWLGVPKRCAKQDLRKLGSAFLRPFLLWVASSLLILSFGSMYTFESHTFVHDGRIAEFLPFLPIHNAYSRLLMADAVQSSHRPSPHIPSTASGTRATVHPFKAGVYLSQEALLPGSDASDVHYVVVGILLQGLWIFGIWGLLEALLGRLLLRGAGTDWHPLLRVRRGEHIFSPGRSSSRRHTSPFSAAMLFTPNFKRMRGSAVAGATAGALAGAALLGHEGSPSRTSLRSPIVMVIQRRKPVKDNSSLVRSCGSRPHLRASWMVLPEGGSIHPEISWPDCRSLIRFISRAIRRPLLTVVAATV